MNNHREVLAAMDFLTVPTLTFQLPYVLVVIEHDRRKVLHVNVTAHPTAAWGTQQMREAFPFRVAPRILLMDRDSIFSAEVCRVLKHMDVPPVRTSFRSPWQNGVVERWVGTCRRELLDHVIVMGEGHLRRLLHEFLDYYHNDRPTCRSGRIRPRQEPCAQHPRSSPRSLRFLVSVAFTIGTSGGKPHDRRRWGFGEAQASAMKYRTLSTTCTGPPPRGGSFYRLFAALREDQSRVVRLGSPS